MDENPDDLVDEIVVNEDIYNDLNSDNEVNLLSKKVYTTGRYCFHICVSVIKEKDRSGQDTTVSPSASTRTVVQAEGLSCWHILLPPVYLYRYDRNVFSLFVYGTQGGTPYTCPWFVTGPVPSPIPNPTWVVPP